MKRFLIIALCLATLAGMAAAQPNPWDPNYYTGTFRGHGDFVPKGNGVWDLGDPGNHWRKAYVDSLLGSALIGYADSSHRADSLKYGAGYFAGTSFLRSDVPDTGTYPTFDSVSICGPDIVIRNGSGCYVGVTIGNLADGFENGVSIGYNSRGRSLSTAVGWGARVEGASAAVAVGQGATVMGGNGIAIGVGCSTSTITGIYSDIAIGKAAKSDSGSVAIGYGAVALRANSGVLSNFYADTSRMPGYWTIRNIDNDTLRSAQAILLATTKKLQWSGGAYLKDTLGTRLRSISVSFDSTWTDNVLPRTTGTGSIGASGNAFNTMYADSLMAQLYARFIEGSDSIVFKSISTVPTIYFYDGASSAYIYYSAGSAAFKTASNITGATGRTILNLPGGILDTLTRVTSDTAKFDNILPITANTGSIGSATNRWNSLRGDSVVVASYVIDSATVNSVAALRINNVHFNMNGGHPRICGDGTSLILGSTNNDGVLGIFPSNAIFYLPDSGKYSKRDSIKAIAKIKVTAVGGSTSADTISGYNGNTWAVNSWGITITGTDTLGKFYMASFDSLKMVRCWASAKSASSGGDPDTLVYMDSLKTDSVKVAWAVGSLWLAPAVLNKKWPTNPAGVLNPVYCIFRKGATTAAANLQVWTTYGLSKGRMF